MSKYTYTLTTDEDQVLLDMIQFFDDMGLPDSFDSKAFERMIVEHVRASEHLFSLLVGHASPVSLYMGARH